MEHLSTIMRPIRYGYLHKSGKKIISYDFDEEEFWYGYKLQTPQEVIDNKLGVCWDQVEFERAYCEKHEIPCNTYFSISGRNGGTHTFLVFKTEDNKLYYFENSWQRFRGIHGPFTSVKDIFKTNRKQDIEQSPKNINKSLRFFKYGKPQYGCGSEEFQRFAMKHLVYTIKGGV